MEWYRRNYDDLTICVYDRCNAEKNFIKRVEGSYNNNRETVTWDPKAFRFIWNDNTDGQPKGKMDMYPVQSSTTWLDGRWHTTLRVDSWRNTKPSWVDYWYGYAKYLNTKTQSTTFEEYFEKIQKKRIRSFTAYLSLDRKSFYETYAFLTTSNDKLILRYVHQSDAVKDAEENVKLSPKATACTIMRKFWVNRVFREENCGISHLTYCSSYCVLVQQRCIRNHFALWAGYTDYEDGKALFENNPTLKQCFKIDSIKSPAEKASFLEKMSRCIETRCNTEVSFIKSVEGCYGEESYIGTEYENGWHYVRITWDEDAEQFTWRNRAGIEWTLKPVEDDHGQWSTTKLAVGEDCPYYEDGHKEAALEYKDNKIYAIRGPNGKPYTKKATSCP